MSVLCSICKKTFANKNSLRAHKHAYHKNIIDPTSNDSTAIKDFGMSTSVMDSKTSRERSSDYRKREYSTSESDEEQPKRHKINNDIQEESRLIKRLMMQQKELQDQMNNTLKRNSREWSQLIYDIAKLKADVSNLEIKTNTQTGHGYDIEKLRSDISSLNDDFSQQRGLGYEWGRLACKVSSLQKELDSLKHKDPNKERERKVLIQDLLTDIKNTIGILSSKVVLSNTKINRIRKLFQRLKRFDKICKFTNKDELEKVEKVANASKDSISEVLVELKEDMETLLGSIHSKMEAYYVDDVDSEDLYSNESEEECSEKEFSDKEFSDKECSNKECSEQECSNKEEPSDKETMTIMTESENSSSDPEC